MDERSMLTVKQVMEIETRYISKIAALEKEVADCHRAEAGFKLIFDDKNTKISDLESRIAEIKKLGEDATVVYGNHPIVREIIRILKSSPSDLVERLKRVEDENKLMFDIVSCWEYHSPQKCQCSFGGNLGNHCELSRKTNSFLHEKGIKELSPTDAKDKTGGA